MPVGAVIGGAASLGGAALQANAAKKAAKTQARGAELARADLEPFRLAGTGATTTLAQLYGIDPATGQVTGDAFSQPALDAFTRSPDYAFARQEGLRGVEFSNAAKGLLKSGNNLRGLTDYAENLATQNFGNYRGALQQLAALGQNAAAGTGNASQAQAAALASGQVGQANAYGGALGNIANYAMLSSLMKPPGSAYGGGGPLGSFSLEQNVGIPANLGNSFIPSFG